LEQLSFAANSNVYNLGTTDQEKDFALYYITNWSDQAPSAGSPELTQAILRRMTPENVLDASDKNHKELLDGACNDLGLKLKSDEYAYALKLIRDQLSRWYDRKQVAESLVATGAPVRLYGRGWREDEGFRPYAQGSVAQGADLAEVYRKAAIVVQVNHAGNAHARVFEAIACGAVVIARSHPSDFQPGGLNAHLEIGKEILTFSNDGELKHIVERLLNDKPYYHSILDAARTRVLRDHTYLARTKQMLGDVTTNLARWAERTQS
jgi:hypothetical protein